MKPILVLAATLLPLAAGSAQEQRGLAIVNARLLPMTGPAIERGTLLVRDGKIQQLGADIAVPPGYTVVDAAGGTVMPGAVSAHAHTGLSQTNRETGERPNRFRRGGGRRRGGRGGAPAGNAEDNTADKVIEQLYARQDVFDDVLRDGVTTLGLAPLGRGLPGQGAVVRPHGDDVASMTVSPSAFVSIAPVADTKTKDLIRKALEAGKRTAERRKRRGAAPGEAAPEKAEGEAAAKPAEKPAEGEPGKEPGREPEKPSEPPAREQPAEGAREGGGRGQAQEEDPAAEVMADLVEGKTRAFVQVDSAMDVVHWEDVVKDSTFPAVFVSRRHASSSSEGSLELVIDKLKKAKGTLLLAPEFDTMPNTQYLVNVAARMHAAGLEVGFLLPDHGRALTATRPQLMELVRAGLPADAALRGITAVPAKALGVADTVGTLEPGKKANLLLWTADPLDPLAELRHVWLEGKQVEEEAR